MVMEEYKVNITDEALKDMEIIYRYIADNLCSAENAIGQYNRIAEAILSLSVFPMRFSRFDMEPERSWGMRKMVIDNYLVCYIVDFNVVTVTDILYGASDIHERLKERHT